MAQRNGEQPRAGLAEEAAARAARGAILEVGGPHRRGAVGGAAAVSAMPVDRVLALAHALRHAERAHELELQPVVGQRPDRAGLRAGQAS